ncbi:ROK family transcriptional regulator [Phytomonospora sp. NPDC050363]|uniref:ROK family transcriptional regulator n=1 Tax=Phytomonospora sp. NPDC050363 TaxID=3155642 RepID=UPI0033CE9930
MKRTSRDIRLANTFEILQHIAASSPVSRQVLAGETGLSVATVSTLVGELVALGVVREVGFEESGGGRPRGLVAVDSGGGALVGVDIAETYVHVEVYDLGLQVLATAEEELRADENTPAQVIAHIVSTITGAAGSGGPRLLGVGVSVPGQVDREGGVSVFAPNFNWHDIPLREELATALRAEGVDLPIYLDNPLKAATVAELWFGAGRKRRDVAVVNLGTGVGAGLALGGELHRGVTNSAGEWGHTTLVLDGRLCRCGAHGCVEAYIGAPGIMRQLRETGPDSLLLAGDDQTATIEAIAAAHADGDPVAIAVVAETGRYLAAALAGLVNLINPEVIVLGGWVTDRIGEALLAECRAALPRYALRLPLEHVEIAVGKLALNTVSLGAATFALEGFLGAVGTTSAPVKARTARPARRD